MLRPYRQLKGPATTILREPNESWVSQEPDASPGIRTLCESKTVRALDELSLRDASDTIDCNAYFSIAPSKLEVQY